MQRKTRRSRELNEGYIQGLKRAQAVIEQMICEGKGLDDKVLFEAVRRGDLKCLNEALESGIDVDAQFDRGLTALSLACLLRRVDFVQRLLNAGADPNVADVYGTTALMLAASDDDNTIVKMLLTKGADVSARTDKGETVLFLCSHTFGDYPQCELPLK